MSENLQHMLPEEIERRSFEIIAEELGPVDLAEAELPVLKRVIHTTADFDYRESLCFSPGAVEKGIAALKRGATIITDTRMAWSGISKPGLAELGARAECFIADADIAKAAKERTTTRSAVSMDKAAGLPGELIFAIGNAPTALLRLHELITREGLKPALIIGVPVGFVNVVESKELIMTAGAPCIVARGRKGGSNVAAAICNAMIYQATGRSL